MSTNGSISEGEDDEKTDEGTDDTTDQSTFVICIVGRRGRSDTGDDERLGGSVDEAQLGQITKVWLNRYSSGGCWVV